MEQLYTIEEIRAKVESGQYGAELMLRHLLALYDGMRVERDQERAMVSVWKRLEKFALKQRDEARDQRDQARRDEAWWKDSAVASVDMLIRFRAERDEARSDAVRLADRVANLEETLRHTSRLLEKAEAAPAGKRKGVGTWLG